MIILLVLAGYSFDVDEYIWATLNLYIDICQVSQTEPREHWHCNTITLGQQLFDLVQDDFKTQLHYHLS